jgi:hypothetical protein
MLLVLVLENAMQKNLARLIAAAAFVLPALALRAEPHWPDGARLYFIAPANGAVVSGKVEVKFGLKGAGVAPAGTDKHGVGHHHLLIDADTPQGDALSQPLPATTEIKHFGGGQTETVLDLPPGRHKLQLILGDANHIPHDPPLVSDVIEIEVK